MFEGSDNIGRGEFAKYVDGFSIGSNDLTQLTLGLDRDSHLVSHLYDERNPAVKALIKQLIKVCAEKGVKVGICGQAPSDFPEFAAFLVEQNIGSISVTPDSILKTLNAIDRIETNFDLLKKSKLRSISSLFDMFETKISSSGLSG